MQSCACGASSPDGAKFCSQCGAALRTDTPPPAPAPQGTWSPDEAFAPLASPQQAKRLARAATYACLIGAAVLAYSALSHWTGQFGLLRSIGSMSAGHDVGPSGAHGVLDVADMLGAAALAGLAYGCSRASPAAAASALVLSAVLFLANWRRLTGEEGLGEVGLAGSLIMLFLAACYFAALVGGLRVALAAAKARRAT